MFCRLLLAAAAAPADSTHAQTNMVPHPPSTLLPPGTTTLPLQLTTAEPSACKWDTKDTTYASMANSFAGNGTTSHSTTLTSLSGNLQTSALFVRCAAFPTEKLALIYRALPDVEAMPFPKLGNLWGNSNFRGHPEGLAYAAKRASLWLGSNWNATEIAELRAANSGTIVLTSINACETTRTDLPDDFYLTNVTRPAATKGRLQSWPGAFRLDLTNPAVQEWQAELMYGLVAFGGIEGRPFNVTPGEPAPLTYDGLFVDNVFMDDGIGTNSQDIFHNPFFPATRTPGKADDPADFGERWRAGMVRELKLFRQKMPHALMDGHISVDAMRNDANISGTFNAVSIGFTTPRIVESSMGFEQGMAQYHDWMTMVKGPHITMVESAVRLQLGYGYGFGKNLTLPISFECENSNSVPGVAPPAIGDACSHPRAGMAGKRGFLPPETYLFARSEYQYMRFGLGFTLMEDGYCKQQHTHQIFCFVCPRNVNKKVRC